jgi:hypothetical protein
MKQLELPLHKLPRLRLIGQGRSQHEPAMEQEIEMPPGIAIN